MGTKKFGGIAPERP